MSIINVKFDVYFKRELGTLFKSNEVDLDGLEANVNLDLDLVENMKINYLINGNKLTDDIVVKDIEKRLILIPFKSEVRVGGEKIQFEIQANMKNGDVKVSQTYVYDVEMGIGEGVQVGTGGSGDGHSHNNLSTLHKITEAKIKAWDAKSDFSGSYNDLTNKPTIPTVDVTKSYVDGEVSKKADKTHSHSEYATPSYVQEKIAEASLSGGEVDLSAYATKAELNTKADKSHTHNELHSHSNKTVLDGITSSKVNEWNNKSTFNGDYNSLTNKPVIPSTEGLATETYVQEKISEASLGGGEVDLSDYATKEYVNIKVTENTDKITVLNADMNSRYSNQQIDEKVSEMIITKINGDLVFRDIFEGEKFEINEDNVVAPPTDVYGNILISTTTLSFAENASTTFTVKLDKAPTNNQVVNLSVNNAYCTLNKTSLTFTPSNYSTVQTVTVAGVHDSNNYSNKTSIIDLTSSNVANKTISVTINNVDTPPVVTVPVTGVSLSPSAHTMKVGQTIRLTATVSPSDATNKNVTWNVNNANATVVDGLVMAKNEGECIITVTTEDGNKTAACQMVIEAKNENDEEYPIDVIPVIDLDVANWDGTSVLVDKRGNYNFKIDKVSKYTKIDDGILISTSGSARSDFTIGDSYSVRIKMKFNELTNAYGRFWRFDGDAPSLYVEKLAATLTYKAYGSGTQSRRISTPNTFANTLIDVICCCDSTTQVFKVYVNSELVGNFSGDYTLIPKGKVLTLGNIDDNTYNIDFEIYEFQVYEQALTDEQVGVLYHAG